MFGQCRFRGAFTIVELLVVISIIGVLIGLLLPAVQYAREAGRRTQCFNNMKQLSLGMMIYESKFGYLPYNWGTTDHNGQNRVDVTGDSWISLILPNIEEESIYKHIKFGEKLTYNQGQYDNLDAAKRMINTLVCPSDAGRQLGTTFTSLMYPDVEAGTTNYKACAGSNWKYSVDPVTQQLQSTPVPGQKGRLKPPKDQDDGLDNGNGIICRNNVLPEDKNKIIRTTMSDIRDGTSHTFAVGETIPSLCNFNAWYWFDGTTATCGIPLNYINPAVNPSDPNDWTYTYGFRSRHPGGGNFCMCDGSGRWIRSDIDITVYQMYGTIAGGELIQDSE